MLREFTKAIGRFKEGDVRDYPQTTWNRMATEAKSDLEAFTKEIPINTSLQNPLRGPVKIRKRLGSVH